MIKCGCGGYMAELGELEDQNNPCICKDLKIKELEKQIEELIKQIITSCIDEDWSVNDAYDLLEKITGKPIEEILEEV